MATHLENNQREFSTPGHRPSFLRSVSSSFSGLFKAKDEYFFELEFLNDTPSYHQYEKKQIVADYIEIGRSRSSYIRFRGEGIEEMVSGTHISITRNGTEWKLTHLSKINSTIINGGERIIRPDDSFKDYYLRDKDTIQLAKGGPVMRFVIPEHNNINVLRDSLIHKLSYIKKRLEQDEAAHKEETRKLKISACIIIALLIGGFTAYSIYLNHSFEKRLEAEIAKVIPQESVIEPQQIEPVSPDSSQIQTPARHVDPIPTLTMAEMIRNQNIAADIYFLRAIAYVELDGQSRPLTFSMVDDQGVGHEVTYAWTATGFLLDDGRFVTGRHCIEGWWYDMEFLKHPNDATRILCASLLTDRIKVYSVIEAKSTKSGKTFNFTSNDFRTDHSKDMIVKISQFEDGTDMKWRFPFPISDDWDQRMYATDWAYIQTNDRGSLQADPLLSTSLIQEQELLVMGFPKGIGAENINNISPISYRLAVSCNGLGECGCIMHSAGTDHGNSGGPVFAVKDGKLVVIGIVSRGDYKSDYYNWAVPISRIGR